jgi:hypothetical protein
MRGIFDLKAYKMAQSKSAIIDRGQAVAKTDPVDGSAPGDGEDAHRQSDCIFTGAPRHAVADLARELWTVADNLQRALADARNERKCSEKSLIREVEAAQRLVTSALKRFGVFRADAFGQCLAGQTKIANGEPAYNE